jgi:hypothetical protein
LLRANRISANSSRVVALEPGEGDLVGLSEIGGRVRDRRAVEPIGFAGATLIHEHDVARALDTSEDFTNLSCRLRRALARAAGEKDERVGRLGADRGEHRNEERDLAASLRDSRKRTGSRSKHPRALHP